MRHPYHRIMLVTRYRGLPLSVDLIGGSESLDEATRERDLCSYKIRERGYYKLNDTQRLINIRDPALASWLTTVYMDF